MEIHCNMIFFCIIGLYMYDLSDLDFDIIKANDYSIRVAHKLVLPSY